LQNAQNSTARGQLQDFDALRKGQDSVLAEIARRRADARREYGQANIDADSDAVGRAVSTPVDPSTLPPRKTLSSPNKGVVYSAVAAKRAKKRKRLS
jgi:hypothetical protein